jgi:hypothetical protein
MNDMEVYVKGDKVTQNFAFTDSFSIANKKADFCGPLTIKLNPSLPFATL